jgi:hypothetical protein
LVFHCYGFFTNDTFVRFQIEEIFEPVVQHVLGLVRSQIKNVQVAYLPVKAIVLVGGFGGSEYLYRRVCQENPEITVMQPPNA